MAKYPRDQFDSLPDNLLRVGAHRGPQVKGRGWIAFAWAALATGALVVAGLYVVSRLDDGNGIEIPNLAQPGTSQTPAAAATAEPVTDPTTIADRAITITVLNGTEVDGLESTAATALTDKQWAVGSEATSSANDIDTTVVYYSDAVNEDVARGIVLALGVGEVRLSDAYVGAPITVVLGADYAPAQ